MPLNLARALGCRDDPVVARCAPFAIFIAFLVIGSIVSKWSPAEAAPGAEINWLPVARNAFVALALLWFWRGYGELRNTSPARPSDWLLGVLAGVAVFLLWIAFDQDWAMLSRGAGFDPSLPGGGTNWPLALARLAGFALVVPVMEELFWRSFLLRWIERHDFLSLAPQRVGLRAFAVTAVLFAVEHNQWLAALLAGIVYNFLYMRSGSLWVVILAHGVTNAALGVWILATRNWQFW